jgi:hypothetical protein
MVTNLRFLFVQGKLTQIDAMDERTKILRSFCKENKGVHFERGFKKCNLNAKIKFNFGT